MAERRVQRWWLGGAAVGAVAVVASLAWWRFARNAAASKAPSSEASSMPAVERSEPRAGGAARVATPSQPNAAPSEPSKASSSAAQFESRSFWGRALDDETGTPIVGAVAKLQLDSYAPHSTRPKEEELPAIKSDSRGFFALRLPPGNRASAWLHASGFTPAFFDVDSSRATEELAFVVRLRRGASIEVRARDVTTGPLSDAAVTISTEAYQLTQPEGTFLHDADQRWYTRTDANGVVEFDDLPTEVPLAIELLRRDTGSTTAFDDIVLARGEKRVVELVLGGKSTVRGVLLDDRGEPVPAQQLWLANHPLAANGGGLAERIFFYTSDGDRARSKPVTDEHGRFAIDDVPRGRWWIGPAATHHWFEDPDERAVCALATRVDVDGVGEVELEVRTQRGLFITGTVFDPNGKPTAAPVTARPETGLGGFIPGYHVRGELNSIGPLMPGKYFVYANGVDSACDSEPVLVEAGARDVELHLRAGGALRGTTIDAATREALRCKVYVSQPSEYYAGTDSDGSFDLGGIPAGRCDVIATTFDGRCAIARGVDAVAGGEPVQLELALQAAARVRVAYSGPAEYGQFTIFDGDTIVAADGLHTHTSAVHTVPAGHLRVRMRMGGEADQVRELDVSIGEEPTVRFTFE